MYALAFPTFSRMTVSLGRRSVRTSAITWLARCSNEDVQADKCSLRSESSNKSRPQPAKPGLDTTAASTVLARYRCILSMLGSSGDRLAQTTVRRTTTVQSSVGKLKSITVGDEPKAAKHRKHASTRSNAYKNGICARSVRNCSCRRARPAKVLASERWMWRQINSSPSSLV
jgi:hypothetical protein